MNEAKSVRCLGVPRLGPCLAARALAIAVLLLACGPTRALAHELLDAEESTRFVERISKFNAVIAASESLEERTAALYDLGETLFRVTELLNRDLAFHGGQFGLISQVLFAELERRGIAFAFCDAAKRYRSYLAPFKEYLATAPEGPRASDAMFRVLYGRFYDSFIYDPMQPLQLDWGGLLNQIEMAESLISRYPDHGDSEEARFILAVEYARAARTAPDADGKKVFFERAQTALRTFVDAYPESLRAAAARVLLESLSPPD
ncbi:MAG: tol-pal system YbgF family protein [Gemmatimonadales bacterium]